MHRMLAKRRDNCRQELKKHRNNIKLDHSKYSVISKHVAKPNHDFDWEKVSILDFEKNYHKKYFWNVIHIKEQKNSLNLMKDTELLDNSNFNIFDDIREHKWSQFWLVFTFWFYYLLLFDLHIN